MVRSGFDDDAEAGESAQQPIQGAWMGTAQCRELVNGTRVIVQSIRQAQAGGGTEHSAARITHRHLCQHFVWRNIPDNSARFCHLFFLRRSVLTIMKPN
jgi:hypothetical protein